MKQIDLLFLGGAGLNIMNQLMTTSANISKSVVNIIGADTSNANSGNIDAKYPIEYVEGANGSGGLRSSKNLERYPDFVEGLFAKYKFSKTVIITLSLAGGSGSSIIMFLLPRLMEAGHNVILNLISDESSINESRNCTNTKLSIFNKVKHLGHPLAYCPFENNDDNNQMQVNQEVIATIKSAIIMFGENHERIDQSDIDNFFHYNRVTTATPTLSRLDFLNEADIEGYEHKPVASIDLFQNMELIHSVFKGIPYRKAGIINTESGLKAVSVHAVLEHGGSIKELNSMAEKQSRESAQSTANFKLKEELTVDRQANESGEYW